MTSKNRSSFHCLLSNLNTAATCRYLTKRPRAIGLRRRRCTARKSPAVPAAFKAGVQQLEARQLLTATVWEVDGVDLTATEAAEQAQPGDTIRLAEFVHEPFEITTADIVIEGEGTHGAIIDGNGAQTALRIRASGVIVVNVVIQNGRGTNAVDGGGIHVHAGASVFLQNVVLRNNIAKRRGGGVNLEGNGSRLTARNSEFDSNHAGPDEYRDIEGYGAAVYIGSGAGAEILDSVFSANTAWNSGTIYQADEIADGTPRGFTLIRSRLSGNSADNNPGVDLQHVQFRATIANNLFYNNNSILSTSAIYANGPGTIRILNNTIDQHAVAQTGDANKAYGLQLPSTPNAEILNNSISNSEHFGILAPEFTTLAFNNIYTPNGENFADGTTDPGENSFDAPGYNDAVNADYTLAANSPLLNSGSPDPAFANSAERAANMSANIGHTGGVFSDLDASFDVLPLAAQARLKHMAQVTMRLFLEPEAWNNKAGVPHSALYRGPYRLKDSDGAWQEQDHDVPNGYGSHMITAEAGKAWKILANAFRLNWLDEIPDAAEKYSRTWGVIRKGLETFQGIVNSTDELRFKDNLLFRSYVLVGPGDVELEPSEIRRPLEGDSATEQSADDNLLFIENLAWLWGAVSDLTTPIPDADREIIRELIHEIISKLDVTQFYRDDTIVFNIKNGILSGGTWNRLNAEGSVLNSWATLAPMGIDLDQFLATLPTLENHPVTVPTHTRGRFDIPNPVYEGQMFPAVLSLIHSMPAGRSENPLVNQFSNSVGALTQAQLSYADQHGIFALFDHNMVGEFDEVQLLKAVTGSTGEPDDPNSILPGNERGLPTVIGDNAGTTTTTASLTEPLMRPAEIAATDALMLLDILEFRAESAFDDSATGLGIETAITLYPGTTERTWLSTRDGQLKLTDFGTMYSTIHQGYFILQVMDALHPDQRLHDINIHKERIRELTNATFAGTTPDADLFRSPDVFLTQDPGSGRVRATLAGRPTHDVTILVNAGSRFQEAPFEITLAPQQWNTGVEFDLTPIAGSPPASHALAGIQAQTSSLDPFYFDISTEVAGISLNIASDTIGEPDGTTTATIHRYGAATADLTVSLTSSNTEQATVPAAITIPTDATISQEFSVTAVDDDFADGEHLVTITALTAEFDAVHAILNVEDDDIPGLSLLLAVTTATEADGTTTATVSRNTDTTDALVVSLFSSDNSAATVPETIMIPAGAATSAPFNIDVIDDLVADGRQMTTITAIADGHADGSGSLTVLDDEIASLTITIAAERVQEGDGADATTATVIRDGDTQDALTVRLSSSDILAASVPETVTIPAGETASSPFNISAVDDNEADGRQVATITATADGLNSGTDIVEVLDDETPTLTITIDADSVEENAGSSAATATVSRDGDTFAELTVSLSVSGGELAIPQTVVIPAGQSTSSAFAIDAVDDPTVNGTRTVTLTAAASGLNSGSDSLQVTDNDVAGISVLPTTLTVDEFGTQSRFDVELDAQPLSNVVVNVISSDAAEALIDFTALTFTSANWNILQTITVTGVDDFVADGTQNESITVSVNDGLSDDAFDLVDDVLVAVEVADNDSAGLQIGETDGDTTIGENGGTDAFTVALTAQPIGDVIVSVTSENMREVTTDVRTLTFSAVNWDTPQIVNVAGVDNFRIDGDRDVIVTIQVDEIVSDDAFAAAPDQAVTVNTLDNDVAGFMVMETGGGTQVTEESTDTFSVSLTAEPLAEVMLNVVSDDTDEVTVDVVPLTFTPANWNQPQTVTVSGVQDHTVDGDQSVPLRIRVDSSSDAAFASITEAAVNTTVIDVPTLDLDIDVDGLQQALTDGILAIRFTAGFVGDSLIRNAVNLDGTRTSAAEILTYLMARHDLLDIDGDGVVQPLTDGVLFLRYLAGFSGATLIRGAIAEAATRTTAPEIQVYLAELSGLQSGSSFAGQAAARQVADSSAAERPHNATAPRFAEQNIFSNQDGSRSQFELDGVVKDELFSDILALHL